MKSILVLFLITFILPTAPINPDLEEVMNKDFKILNLFPSSFQSHEKGKMTHKNVVTEIKKNFAIDSDIAALSTRSEYTKDDMLITEWKISNHSKYHRIIESKSEVYIKNTLYKFTYYLIELKEPSVKLRYFTEENYGLISYAIKDKTTHIKRTSKSQRLQEQFEEMCKIKEKMETRL